MSVWLLQYKVILFSPLSILYSSVCVFIILYLSCVIEVIRSLNCLCPYVWSVAAELSRGALMIYPRIDVRAAPGSSLQTWLQ